MNIFTQIHETSQINSEYIRKYNLTFPRSQTIHVWMNFGRKISQKLAYELNSAVMQEIVRVSIPIEIEVKIPKN